jgi:hypothetical protein
VQAPVVPGGVPLRVSDILPGSISDLTARELALPGAWPYLNDPHILADSGCEGAGLDGAGKVGSGRTRRGHQNP